MFGNDLVKDPGYRMRLVELLPLIDDIDGTPMKTTYNIVFGNSNKDIKTEDNKDIKTEDNEDINTQDNNK
jgi:hypothetical protein